MQALCSLWALHIKLLGVGLLIFFAKKIYTDLFFECVHRNRFHTFQYDVCVGVIRVCVCVCVCVCVINMFHMVSTRK